MVCPEWLRHVGNNRLNIRVSTAGFLLQGRVPRQTRLTSTEEAVTTYVYPYSVGRLPFPGAVNDLDLDETFDIWIELVHEKVDIEEIVELPALLDQGVPENVPKLDRLPVIF
jgi:hypothetical protein